MKMSLYKLTEEDRVLNDLISDIDTEEDQDYLVEVIDEITNQINSKGSGIIKAVNTNKSMIKAVDEEIKRLQAYKKSLVSKNSKFEEYILFCMSKLGVKKIETKLGVISQRKTPAKLVIQDESKIESKYVVIKQTESVDKTTLKNDIKAGKVCNYAHLESGISLNIK